VKNSSTKAIFGLEKHQCPTGTVAIRRTPKEDLIQGKSYFNNVLYVKNTVNHVSFLSHLSVLNFFIFLMANILFKYKNETSIRESFKFF
jgi:hypothetical protein